MPKVTFGVAEGGRIRVEHNYEDYKQWEKLLKDADHAYRENTTMHEDGSYWKTLEFRIGKTEYRIGGPVMTSRRDD